MVDWPLGPIGLVDGWGSVGGGGARGGLGYGVESLPRTRGVVLIYLGLGFGGLLRGNFPPTGNFQLPATSGLLLLSAPGKNQTLATSGLLQPSNLRPP